MLLLFAGTDDSGAFSTFPDILIILDPTDFYAPLSGFLNHLESEKFLKPHQLEALTWTKTIDDALDACIKKI